MHLPVSALSRLAGLCLLLGSLPLAIRLVWEMTLLTWHQGPQMIGFSIAHAMPWLLILGVASTLGGVIWCIWIGAAAIFRLRSLARLDWVLFIAIVATGSSQMVPYAAWQWATLQVLGSPKPESPAWQAMYDTLTSAAKAGDAWNVERLLRHGLNVNGVDRQGETALYAASSCGRSQTVKYLLQHGAQVNLQNRNGETALHTAAQHGYLETVKELTAAGADPAIRSNSGRGFSAADLAWSSNQIAVSKFLDSLKVR